MIASKIPINKFSGLASIFRSLRYKNFRLFFSGQSVSLIGTWIQRIAMPWLVYRLTDSAFLLGLVGFAGQIPTFILAPFAGVITDRLNRYNILIVTQILEMVQALILAILFFTGTIQVWHIIILSVILGTINAFDMPTRQAFLVDMIEDRKDLGNAIALNSTMVNGARLIGPSIAGMLIAATNEGVCFLLNGVSYIFVIVSLLLMKISPKELKHKSQQIWEGLKEGFKYTFGFIPLRSIILLLAVVSLMGMPYAILMPVFATKILHGDSHTFGFLMGASGTGALFGALYLASRKSVLGLGKIIPLSAGTFGMALVVFALSKIFFLSLIMMLITGFAMMLQLAASNTILQTIVEDDKRGRVMSFYTMAFVGTAPFGSLIAGWLATYLGAPGTLIIGGASILLSSLVFASKLPSLRNLVRPIYVNLGILPKE